MRLYDIKQSVPFKSVALSFFLGIVSNFASSAETAQQQESVGQVQEQQAEFDLLELRVKGNTLLERKELERAIYPFLGPKKNADVVEQASKALEDLYRGKGYQSVEVYPPEQNVENGVVYLQVVEGKVSRLRVKDSKYFSLDKIKEAVPEIAEGKVPNFPVMQKQLEKLGNESADRQVTPILRAGETPGTLEVDLKVKDELPLHGRLEINGRNTSTTSLTRLVASMHYDNLWQRMHSASLMYQVSPEDNKEVDVWAGTYAMPFFNTGAKLAFYGVSSSSNSQIASAGALSVVGIGDIYGLRLVKPLPGFDSFSHTLTAGVDYKDFQENLNLVGSDSLPTPISYLPFSLQYGGDVRGKKSLTSFHTGLNFSIRGLGNDQEEFENKRFNSRPNYIYLNSGLNVNYDLPLGMELASRLSGQVADSPLISNEQFSLGGIQSVRGYFETQALADDGFNGSIELRSPRLAPSELTYINKLQALIFVDGGMGWIQDALPGSPDSYDLASTGVGMRFQMWRYITGVLDLGIPLIDLDVVEVGEPKFHFIVATEF